MKKFLKSFSSISNLKKRHKELKEQIIHAEADLIALNESINIADEIIDQIKLCQFKAYTHTN